MENQNAVPQNAEQNTVPAPEAAATGVQNTLGVIKVVEGLFNGMRAGSYPLHVHEQVQHGMSFLAQFHTQLVSQLPPAVVEEMRKKAEAPNEPVKA